MEFVTAIGKQTWMQGLCSAFLGDAQSQTILANSEERPSVYVGRGRRHACVCVCVCEVLSMHNGLQGSVISPSKYSQTFLMNVLQLSGGAEIGYIWSDKVRL